VVSRHRGDSGRLYATSRESADEADLDWGEDEEDDLDEALGSPPKSNQITHTPTADEPPSTIESKRTARREAEVRAWHDRRGKKLLWLSVPDRLLALPGLPLAAKVFFAFLLNVNQRERKGNVAPYQKTLAEFLQVSDRQIRRYATECEEHFLLTVEKRGRAQSSVYYLHPSWDLEEADHLILPWKTRVLARTARSRQSRDGGRIRPKAEDISVSRQDENVRRNGHSRPHL